MGWFTNCRLLLFTAIAIAATGALLGSAGGVVASMFR